MAVAFGVSGCSGSSSPSATPAATVHPSASSAAPTLPAADPAAERVLASGLRAMRAVRSYDFDVRERLAAGGAQASHLVGAVVRGEGLTYRLTVGRRTTQVVRLRAATYVRVVPGRWSRLRHPRRLADPSVTLFQIMAALVPTGMGHAHDITAVHGFLPVAAAARAGLPASRPADVTVTMDGHGRVLALDVTTRTQAAGRDVTVTFRATYDAFGQVPRIGKPV